MTVGGSSSSKREGGWGHIADGGVVLLYTRRWLFLHTESDTCIILQPPSSIIRKGRWWQHSDGSKAVVVGVVVVVVVVVVAVVHGRRMYTILLSISATVNGITLSRQRSGDERTGGDSSFAFEAEKRSEDGDTPLYDFSRRGRPPGAEQSARTRCGAACCSCAVTALVLLPSPQLFLPVS